MREDDGWIDGQRVIFFVLVLAFLWLVLESHDDNGPEWSGVSHVDGRP
jgi:hypothetical protein